MVFFSQKIRPSYGQKLSILATIPLVLAVAAIAALVTLQSTQLAEKEIKSLEETLINAKKAELRNYVKQATLGFYYIYGNADPDDEAAKKQVMQILSAMIYGTDGFFFVYDYDGTNLVSPRQTEMINKNWSGLADSRGTPVVDELIRLARSGAGYHTYLWPKPSTGEEAQMISYVNGFQNWRWALGTGVFVDDVMATVAAARLEVETRVKLTFFYIGGITLAALLLVFLTGMVINIRERRLADAKLKQLTQRILDTQEEERSRVARELHDSISQILVGVRFSLELAGRRLNNGDKKGMENLTKGIDTINGAIQEVRRISRDLRPGMLDDLGLGPALKALLDEFSRRTGIQTDIKTVVFRNRLDQDSKIALYRIAQEALTNIERHSEATRVSLSLSGHKKGATLQIIDNGKGFSQNPNQKDSTSFEGLGLRNMMERIEQLDGTIQISSSGAGTTIEAIVPLSHLLPPENKTTEAIEYDLQK
ncbi:cache domain-containing protein [Rhodobacteraceae bacterium nBUS_24]